jgi:hypothetical protein
LQDFEYPHKRHNKVHKSTHDVRAVDAKSSTASYIRHSILINRLKKVGDEWRGKASQCFDAQNKYVRYIDRDV